MLYVFCLIRCLCAHLLAQTLDINRYAETNESAKVVSLMHCAHPTIVSQVPVAYTRLTMDGPKWYPIVETRCCYSIWKTRFVTVHGIDSRRGEIDADRHIKQCA